MAAALPAIGLVGGAIGAAGSLMKGQSTANSLNAQANFQDTQAQQALEAGQFDAFRQQIAARKILDRATAGYGASGVSSNSVSEQAVLMSGAANAEMDRQNILHGAEIRALNYRNQAGLNRFGANSAVQGSYYESLSALLGGSKMLLANTMDKSGSVSKPHSTSSALGLMEDNPGASGTFNEYGGLNA